MPITVQEKAEPTLISIDNPDGVRYRQFDCPSCGYTIGLKLKAVHKCRSCETTVVDVLRLMTNPRYRLCYHKDVINDEGHWDWTKNDSTYF